MVATSEKERFSVGDGKDPDLSLDGRQLVFCSETPGSQESNLVLMNLQNRARKTIFKGMAGGPQFSPDGTKLATQIYDAGKWSAGVIPLDATSNVTILGEEDAMKPHWLPNGTAVVASSLLQVVAYGQGTATGWTRPKVVAEESVASWFDEYVPHPLVKDQFLVSRLEKASNGELESRVVILMPDGTTLPVDSKNRPASNPAWATDGLGILIEIVGGDGNSYVARTHADGSGMSILFAGRSPSQ